ncbi:toxin-antitoxin system YwqK family antitoxin [Candidatus Palauibacter sp.]|uniref:toxin-antitoxin system YwqK family antitoxin n=1 Tax=Candidatus Palauibacter sp. TaxID=3101350 RepID=UPI003B022539
MSHLELNLARTGARGLLAATVLLPGSSPAAAHQAGDAAVACVGSALETLDSSSPVRRLITEDVALVYRVGVRAEDREGTERTLLAELGEHAEVSCVWSDPGDNHVAIVRYTGAVRGDLTLDPDDPRFQAFAVGYGRSAEAAEENATTVNTRFATHYDGAGYEVLVAESWVVSAGAVPGTESAEREPGEPGPIGGAQSTATPPAVRLETCAGQPLGSECWMEVANQPGCHLWNEGLAAGATVTWSGECVGGYAQGPGAEHWRYGDGQQTAQGTYVDGTPHGNWVIRYGDGDIGAGPYASGQRQGTWTWWFSNGNVKETPYVNGELGGSAIECARDPGEVIAWLISYVNGEETAGHTIGLRDPDAPTIRARCSALLNKPRPRP